MAHTVEDVPNADTAVPGQERNRDFSVLEVAGLSFSYGSKRALKGVSFTVSAGEFKLLLGPNGAGKTTLFSLITRLYEADEGRISVVGVDLRRRPTWALGRMGVVFQQPTLDLDLSVRQNLRYHAALHGLAPAEATNRMTDELDRLGVSGRIDEKVRQLSGGLRRRIEIARALLHEPELLLLDEPTVGLDVPSRRDLVAHVHELARARGIAVLWATHLIDESEDDDSVMVLHRGTLRADGPLANVLAASGARDIGEAFDRLTGAGTG